MYLAAFYLLGLHDELYFNHTFRVNCALNHQRLLRQVGLLATEVFDFILVLLAEVIKPQAVAFRIHDLAELILQAPALRRVQQALEHSKTEFCTRCP